MQPHIEKAYSFIDTYLPFEYVAKTQDILNKSNKKVTSTIIRNVRTKKTTSNVTVLNALVKVAKKEKAAIEALLV
jgi:hypothetical protein